MKVRATGTPALRRVLQGHPRVDLDDFTDGKLSIAFDRGDWPRSIEEGDATQEIYGLCELMDNNPLVCADSASCSGRAATLALIAAGPLAKAGLLSDSPAMLFSFETEFDEAERGLAREGWQGINATCEPIDLGTVLSLTCLAQIPTLALSDIDALYDECYGRSFFVRMFKSGSWEPNLVSGTHHALYRLAPSPSDESTSVLRVDVLADENGKCGAAQLVHMFNVMSCFEEDLGLNV